MKNHEQEHDDALSQELLELAFDVHPEPEALRARLAEDADLRALDEEVRATASLLRSAAQDPDVELDLDTEEVPVAVLEPRRSGFGWRAAAAILIAPLALLPAAHWGMQSWQAQRVEDNLLRLVVTGPRAVPDGSIPNVRVETWDADGDAVDAELNWTLFDAEGKSIHTASSSIEGTLDLDIPALMPGAKSILVSARVDGRTQEATLDFQGESHSPLVHLSSDKPMYRPGETVYLRGVFLDRLSLEPLEDSFYTRVRDPKGIELSTRWARADKGVVGFGFDIGEEDMGGEYTFEVLDGRGSFVVESHPFLVKRFQAPRLAQTLELSKETYAPGEHGAIEIEVERVEGGIPVGAPIRGSLVIDGSTVWSEEAELDVDGRVIFEFQIPVDVTEGAARFVSRVTDGGVVESAIEPFVVPVGRLDVAFYPEGGELVAGAVNRVYAEVCDPLGRPTSARGYVIDSEGHRVADFETAHQGRARFDLDVREGEAYRLIFEEPAGPTATLPEVRPYGVVLRSVENVTAPGEDLRVRVHTPEEGSWVLGVFCRGVLVAQDAFTGKGEQELAVRLPENVAGVLRVTVFESDMHPIAERLVQRESGRDLRIEIEPLDERLAPGERQRVTVRTFDESGTPVPAVLGVGVTDRAVRDMLDEERIGLADQAWLLADVEDLEDHDEFLAHDETSRLNVDLLLGTRGWRRFAWVEPKAFVDEYGDEARRQLVLSGQTEVPQVRDTLGPQQDVLWQSRREVREARGIAILAWLGLGVLGLIAGSAVLIMRGMKPGGAQWQFVTGIAGFLVLALGVFQITHMVKSGRPDVAFLAGADFATADSAPALEASVDFPSEMFEDPADSYYALGFNESQARLESKRLEGLGYVGDSSDSVRLLDSIGYAESEVPMDEAVSDSPGAVELEGLEGEPDFLADGPVDGEVGDWSEDAEESGNIDQENDLVDLPALVQAERRVLPNSEVPPAGGVGGGPNPPSAGPSGPSSPGPSSPGPDGFVPARQSFEARRRPMRELGYSMEPSNGLQVVRVYAHENKQAAARSDFQETIYWNSMIVTDEKGEAAFEFELGDQVTRYSCFADAHGAGRVGQGSSEFEARLPFHVEAVLPTEVSRGDRLELPVSVVLEDGSAAEAHVLANLFSGRRALVDPRLDKILLEDGRGRTLLPMNVVEGWDEPILELAGTAGPWRDLVRQRVRVVPRGFPHDESQSGRVEGRTTFVLVVPPDVEPGSLHAQIKLYPSPLAGLQDGLDGMLREPHGCFEQTSSTNYPNVLALSYLETMNQEAPMITRRARGFLETGYSRLTSFECSTGGFDWYGNDPGHGSLTAYGLLQFNDMARVHGVERDMMERTIEWMLDRRDGEGGFDSDNSRYSFGGAPKPILDVYQTYVLAAIGTDVEELRVELDGIEARAATSTDAYELAVAACGLEAGGRKDAAARARKRLVTMVDEDGSLCGSSKSFTSSMGGSLRIETTAFAVLAWLADPEYDARVEAALMWLVGQRNGSGTFGSTQATIMALKAILAHAEAERPTAQEGRVQVFVGGERGPEVEFPTGAHDPIVIDDFAELLIPGENHVTVELTGDNDFPYVVDFGYHSEQPANHPEAPFHVSTALAESTVEEGDTVSLRVEVTNLTAEERASSMAVVGLPAGLEIRPEVLEDLVEAERFAHWEIKGRNLVFYWYGFLPEETKTIDLDLLARIPGTSAGPATRAYPYYTPEHIHWAAPLAVTVTPAR